MITRMARGTLTANSDSEEDLNRELDRDYSQRELDEILGEGSR